MFPIMNRNNSTNGFLPNDSLANIDTMIDVVGMFTLIYSKEPSSLPWLPSTKNPTIPTE